MTTVSETKTCSECDQPARAKGYCTLHYQRARKGSDLAAPAQISIPIAEHPDCFHPTCDRSRDGNGKFCHLHYTRSRKGTDMDAPPRHEWAEEDRWHRNSRGYMERHIKGSSPRRAELQHRVVMAEKLGRALLPHENVHHINGQRADNRPENLELWSKSQPSGQRVEDKMKWIERFLADYGQGVTDLGGIIK